MTFLITGASTGIGWALAEHFVKQGHKVFAGCRKEADAERLRQLGCEPLILDVTNSDHRKSAFEQIESLDVLINNAGIAIAGPVETVDLADFEQQFAVNVTGLFAITQLFIPRLRESKGRIINISSIAGKVSTPFLSPYSSSKFAVEALTDSMRRELAFQEIKVISVNPGPIKTPIWDKGLGQADEILQAMPEDLQELYTKPISALKRVVDESVKHAAGVDEVVKAVDHAVTRANPKTRYFPGKFVGAQATLVKWIPDKWIDKALASL